MRPVRLLQLAGRVPLKALPPRFTLFSDVASESELGRAVVFAVTDAVKDRSRPVMTPDVQVTPSHVPLTQGLVLSHELSAVGRSRSALTLSRATEVLGGLGGGVGGGGKGGEGLGG